MINKGYIAAFSAYLFWGLSPIYWKIIISVPTLEILGLRIFWSFPFLFALMWLRRDFSFFKTVLKSPRNTGIYIVSALLLATNWLVWIWSVTNGYVVDASLGYFINPLLNVFMGFVFLKERLRLVQWVALITALTGVLYLTLNYGQFPWIALTLATTFALYGFIRKTGRLGSVHGLSMEVVYLLIPASLLLMFLAGRGGLALATVGPRMHFWLMLTGFVTVFPLTLFAAGARRIPYSTLGFIQYITPTLHFLLGVFLYREMFTMNKFIGFSFIWVALIVYTYENFTFAFKRRKRKTVPLPDI